MSASQSSRHYNSSLRKYCNEVMMQWSLVVTVVSVVVSVVTAPCPDQCRCDLRNRPPHHGPDRPDPIIFCTGLQSLTPYFFKDVFSLNLYREVEFIDLRVPVLPLNVFSGMWNVSRLTFTQGFISSVDEGAFAGFSSNLKSIYFTHVQIGQIQPGAFYNLTQLHRIKFSDCSLNEIVKDTFVPTMNNGHDRGSRRLEVNYLTIEKSSIRRLLPMAFSGLDRVTDLVLRGNNITEMETSTFAGMSRSGSLTVLNNFVHIIANRAFRGAEHADQIVVLDNIFRHFERYAFDDLVTLSRTGGRRVTVQNNKLTCDCKILWILVHHNNLTDVVRPDRNKCSEFSTRRLRGLFIDRARINNYCSSPLAVVGGGQLLAGHWPTVLLLVLAVLSLPRPLLHT